MVIGLDYLRKEADVMVDEMGRSALKTEKNKDKQKPPPPQKQHKSSGAFEEQMLKGD